MGIDASAVIIAGVSSSATLLVLNIVGVVAAVKGYMTPEFLRSSSKLLTVIVLPALTFGKLASSLSLELIGQAWTVALWALIAIAIGIVVGSVVRFALRLDKVVGTGLARVFVIACAFNNGVSLPLVLLEALCQMDPLDKQTDCFDRGAAAAFLYIAPYLFIFWGGAATLLAEEEPSATAVQPTPSASDELQLSDDKAVGPSAAAGAGTTMVNSSTATTPSIAVTPLPRPSASFLHRILYKALLTPVFISVVLGIAVGLIEPIQSELFVTGGSLRWLSAAITVLGSAAVPMTSLVMAASLGHSMQKAWRRGACRSCRPGRARKVLPTTSDAATAASKDTGDNDDDDDDKLTKASQHHKLDGAPAWTVAALVVTRMLIVAACNVALAVFAMSRLLPSDADPMLLLLMILEAATPPANMLIVVCQSNNFRLGAEFLAMSYIFCYGIGIVTFAATSSVAFATAVE